MKCPCKGCDKRTITCHGVCQRYQSWRKYMDDVNKWLNDQKPESNNSALKGEIRKIKNRARGWNGRRSRQYE